jgi:hypothetical protein
MAKIRNPLQFSRYFKIDQTKLYSLGVFDPTLNVDAKLFIDPMLLSNSEHEEMRDADKTYKVFFSGIIKLLEVSKQENDLAWRTTYKKLLFREIKGTCLGYGAASIRGSGFGPTLTAKITSTAKEIVDLGIKDPDLFIALPLLEEDIGPDLISDMTTNIIIPDLLRFNVRVSHELSIKTESFLIKGFSVDLPRNPLETKQTPVLLVPTDILRKLPIANDWDEVCHVASENAILRDKINKLIGEIWKAKIRKDKKKIREKALASKEAFAALLEAIHGIDPTSYDFNGDPEGILVWRRIHETVATTYPLTLKLTTLTLDDVYGVVKKIIQQFTHLIENRGLSKELWYEGKRREEKSVQRIFFAVADSYCKANNLDISPEVDTGTGEIDFKFSMGYDYRVLVEVKLSDSSHVVSGYEKQLEAYKKAEKTTKGIYLVIDIGKLGKKGEKILKIKNERHKSGLPVSEVIYIDGTIKTSASKL